MSFFIRVFDCIIIIILICFFEYEVCTSKDCGQHKVYKTKDCGQHYFLLTLSVLCSNFQTRIMTLSNKHCHLYIKAGLLYS